MNQTTFAVFIGNRGFFPDYFLKDARAEIKATVEETGNQAIFMDASLTQEGGVINAEEGRKFAAFLEENRGKFDGIILSMPNFTDEYGAIEAIKNVDVPILMQAYPDEIDKMSMRDRRDSFCGKISLMCVMNHYKIPFSNPLPFTVDAKSPAFKEQVDQFARTCRVVKGMKKMVLGVVGSRTTPFKAMRFDEIALQNHGITTETIDSLDLLLRIKRMDLHSAQCKTVAEEFRSYGTWDDVPELAFGNLVKTKTAIDDIIQEYRIDTITIRCWAELQQELGISPCVVLSKLNNDFFSTACETDGCNAIAMHALRLASENATSCLDWNNNYGEEEDKCVLFHCGVAPASMLEKPGRIADHDMIAKAMGKGCSYGCYLGRIKASPFTYASSITKDGKLIFYVGEGEFTNDFLPDDTFGSYGVAHINGLQKKLQNIGYNGFKHHVGVSFGQVAEPVKEAFTRYLGYELFDL